MSRSHEMYTPFNATFDTRTRYFEWLECENMFRLWRFGEAMAGMSGCEAAGSVFSVIYLLSTAYMVRDMARWRMLMPNAAYTGLLSDRVLLVCTFRSTKQCVRLEQTL